MKNSTPVLACLLLTLTVSCTEEGATEVTSGYNLNDEKVTIEEVKPAGPLFTKEQIEYLASIYQDVSQEEFEAVKARFARINALEPSEEVRYGFGVVKTMPINPDSADTAK